MAIGQMKRIRIERWATTKDGKNNKESRVESHSLYADVEHIRSTKEGIDIGDTKSFKIRFRDDWDITGTWKVVYYKKRYSVNSIERIKEKRFNWLISGKG